MNRQNLKWAVKLMSIVLFVGMVEILVGLFVRKPFPWVAWIPTLIPLLICLLVIFPMTRVDKPAPPGVAER